MSLAHASLWRSRRFCLLTSADLRHEEIGTVQIESVSVLVFVVTKQKQNEVFFLYINKKRRKKDGGKKSKIPGRAGWPAAWSQRDWASCWELPSPETESLAGDGVETQWVQPGVRLSGRDTRAAANGRLRLSGPGACWVCSWQYVCMCVCGSRAPTTHCLPEDVQNLLRDSPTNITGTMVS